MAQFKKLMKPGCISLAKDKVEFKIKYVNSIFPQKQGMSNYENLSGMPSYAGFNIGSSPEDTRHTENTSGRAELERDFQTRFTQLKSMYEMRLQAMQESIKNAFKLIQTDELIDTMKQDFTSQEFISQRVKEIMDECINSDREALIEKLTQQFSLLKAEYARLEQENIRISNVLREATHDANKRIEDIHEQYQHEVRNREYYEQEIENLKRSIQDMNTNYDSALKQKDEQIIKKAEREILEAQQTKERIRELEIELADKTNQIWKINQDRTTAQTDLDAHRAKNRELEIDMNSKNVEISELQNKLSTANRTISENESHIRDLKRTVQNLSDESNHLRNEIKNADLDRKNLEESFQRKAREIEQEVHEQQDGHRDTIEKLNKSYKEKIEQYKKKLTDYKNRLLEKENQIHDMNRKNEEEKLINDKNVEIFQMKLNEQKESWEHKLILAEEENHKKINDLHLKHDDQVRELQNHFQALLEQKIIAIQDEASEQIYQLRNQEKEVQTLLEEKILQLDREYIKLTTHDEMLQEKQQLIEKLKQEISKREADAKQELTSKLKSLEDRLNEDHSLAVKTLKNTIKDLEDTVSKQELLNRRLEADISNEKESKKKLEHLLTDSESRGRKMQDTIEDLADKSKKLKSLHEEELQRRRHAEDVIRELQQKVKEGLRQCEEAKSESTDRAEQIKHLIRQIEALENNLGGQVKLFKSLQREYDELKTEFQVTDQQKSESIRNYKEQIENFRIDIKALNDKIFDVMRTEKDRLDLEVAAHFETKQHLKQCENRLHVLSAEIEGTLNQNDKLRRTIDELEREKEHLRQKVENVENTAKTLVKERGEQNRRIENHLNHLAHIKKNLHLFMIAKIGTFRSDLRDLKTYYTTTLNNLIREQEYKFGDVVTQTRILFDRMRAKFEDEKENLRTKMRNEFQNELENMNDRFSNIQKETHLANDQKLHDKESQIHYLNEEIDNLNRRVGQLEKELDRSNRQIMSLEDEISKQKSYTNAALKEKETFLAKYDQTKQRFFKEMEDINIDLQKSQEEHNEERRIIEQRHQVEIANMQEQIEMFKSKHLEALKNFDDDIKSLARAHQQEIENLKRHHEDALAHLKKAIGSSERAEQEHHLKFRSLQERISYLEKQIYEQEQEKANIRAVYERKLEDLENKMEEVNFFIQKENQKFDELKHEKGHEIGQLKSTIQVLQEEIRIKTDRINNLLAERGRFQQNMRDLQAQLEHKADEMEKQRSDIVEKTVQQTKEIEQLHQLLSKSYRAHDSADKNASKEEDENLSKSIEDLKKLNNYLEQSKSSRVTVSGNYRDKSPYSAQRKPQEQEYDTFRTKKLSMSQLKL